MEFGHEEYHPRPRAQAAAWARTCQRRSSVGGVPCDTESGRRIAVPYQDGRAVGEIISSMDNVHMNMTQPDFISQIQKIMEEQFPFDDDSISPEEHRRLMSLIMKGTLFLALFPAADARMSISQLAKQQRAKHQFWGTPQKEDRLHLSLHEVPPLKPIVPLVKDVSAAIAASTSPFEVRSDGVMTFNTKKPTLPFVLQGGGENADLRKFYQRLVIALKQSGVLPKPKSRITPHVTLLYDRQNVAQEPVDPISWTVDEVTLVQSFVGETRYEHLGSWRLQG
jgi:2'-5' RNA ligase